MGLRILLCDDQPDIVQSLALLFQSQGYETVVTYDGAACLAKAREWKPHVAFIDIGLPDISGYQVAREIRASEGGERIYLVALTGYGQPIDRRRALESGFNEHMVKPVDRERLMRTVVDIEPTAAA
jgi:CheY-like chemotaxis protein